MGKDRIYTQVELQAPLSRVWQALTDYRQFGKWFRVKLESPFVAGQATRGHISYPGYEHLLMEIVVKKIDPERLFSFTWHPYAVDPKVDYSKEEPTLVEFKLEEISGGTQLGLTESGFEKIPENRRDEALRMNEGGWLEQMKNIKDYLAKTN